MAKKLQLDRPQIQPRHRDTLTVVTVIQCGGGMKSGHAGGVSLTPSVHGSGGMAIGTCGASDGDRGDGGSVIFRPVGQTDCCTREFFAGGLAH